MKAAFLFICICLFIRSHQQLMSYCDSPAIICKERPWCLSVQYPRHGRVPGWNSRPSASHLKEFDTESGNLGAPFSMY